MNLDDIKSEKAQAGLEDFQLEFLSDRLVELEELKSNVSNSNFEQLASMAHKWKGFSVPYGFHKLEGLAVSIEAFSKNENLEGCVKKLEEVANYLNLKKDYL